MDAVAGVDGVVGEVVRVVGVAGDDVGGPRDEGGLGRVEVVTGRGRRRSRGRRSTSSASGEWERGEQEEDGEGGEPSHPGQRAPADTVAAPARDSSDG